MFFSNFVSFKGTRFNNVNFVGTGYSKYANFYEANFNNSTYFSGAIFYNNSNFSKANFKFVSFYGANFNKVSNFQEANFSDITNFSRVSFFDSVYFYETNFTNFVDFSNAYFNKSASFSNANFEKNAYFFDTSFNKIVNFKEANFTNYANFSEANFGNEAYFVSASYGRYTDFSSATFGDNTYFGWAKFNNLADFSLSTFDNEANFYDANFNNSILFYWTKFNESAGFEGPKTPEHIKATGDNVHTFIKYYNDMGLYQYADEVYYNYRIDRLKQKQWYDFSFLTDIIIWTLCGFGVKPENAFISGMIIIFIFSLAYTNPIRLTLNRCKKIPVVLSLNLSLEKRNNKIFPFKLFLKDPGILKSSDESQKASASDIFYFSVCTFTFISQGNLYPRDNFRKLVIFEGILSWIILGIFMATLTKIMIRI